MDFRILTFLLTFLLLSPAYGEWYILLPKERPQKREIPKRAPVPRLAPKKKELKPYSVEVKKILSPSFVIYTPDLKRVTKGELLGKVTVIIFVKDLFTPYTERLAKEFDSITDKKVQFIIVDIDDADFLSARSFKKLLNLKRVLVTADSYIFNQFKRNLKELKVPSIVIIDRYGFIRFFSPQVSQKKPLLVKREIEGILKELKNV